MGMSEETVEKVKDNYPFVAEGNVWVSDMTDPPFDYLCSSFALAAE